MIRLTTHLTEADRLRTSLSFGGTSLILPVVIALAALAAPLGAQAAPAVAAEGAQVAASDPFQATLTKAVKKVEWQRYATQAWQRALVDTLLLGGDTLRTGGDSKAELLYGDGSVTRVGSLTTLTLTGDRRREIRLDGGKIWLNIRKSGAGMRIITPGAVAAVTGTELMVEFDPTRRTTEVTVFEGAVNVTGDVGDLVKVMAGTTSRVPFKAPAMAPIPLDNTKIQERNNLFRPLSIDTPGAEPTAPPTSGTPTGVAPSAAPTSPDAGRNGQTDPGKPPVNATEPQPNGTTGTPTGTQPDPGTPAGTPPAGTAADKPVNPDLKTQTSPLFDPRVIGGSPTTGTVKVIIE